MRTTWRRLKRSLLEAAAPWIVRGGSEVLVRGYDEPARAWRYVVLPKVTYFADNELFWRPRGPTDEQVWKFRRDGILYAIAERQFFQRPDDPYLPTRRR